MNKPERFKVHFSHNWFKAGDILDMNDSARQVKVITDPHRKWWKLLLMVLTWGYYQPPTEYIVEVVKPELQEMKLKLYDNICKHTGNTPCVLEDTDDCPYSCNEECV